MVLVDKYTLHDSMAFSKNLAFSSNVSPTSGFCPVVDEFLISGIYDSQIKDMKKSS